MQWWLSASTLLQEQSTYMYVTPLQVVLGGCRGGGIPPPPPPEKGFAPPDFML